MTENYFEIQFIMLKDVCEIMQPQWIIFALSLPSLI